MTKATFVLIGFVCLLLAWPILWLVSGPLTTAQATAQAQLIWGPGGWAQKKNGQYQVGCMLNGKKRVEGTSPIGYAAALAAINPANGVHNTTVTDHGVTSNAKPFIVCF